MTTLSAGQRNEPVSGSAIERSWKWLAALLVLVLAGALVLLLMNTRAPDGDSPEAGMLRDMLPHHTQAVEMALIIRDRTEDQQLRALATDILLSQQNQIGMMEGWLDLWDVSSNLQGSMMAWMDHPVEEGEVMPGMAVSEQVESLRTAPVDEAEVGFLQLMIRHHQGAVHMADAYLERGDQEEVSQFARNIIAVQDREIETMNAMLEQRGADPVTDGLDMGDHQH